MKQAIHQYADRFIRENYADLANKFRLFECKLAEKGCSALDKLNDTMLSLYDADREFSSYKQFERWAKAKFTEKIKRDAPRRKL